MTRTPAPKAADQFAALGLTEADYTDAMKVAVTQKWSALPVDRKVADLRADLAAVTVDLPDATNPDRERLARNARVNAWRARTKLQAALDARDLRFTKMRAAKKSPAPTTAKAA